MSPEEILAQARSAASRAKRNLDSARKKIRVGFLRKKEKGEIAYAITEDRDRVKLETVVDDAKCEVDADRPPTLITAKALPSSGGSSLSGKEEPLKDDVLDLYDNKRRFVKELSASLKPKEKPVDKVHEES